MKNYIINGRVAREEIASDICAGIIGRDDIKKLIENPEIKDAFIGESYTDKKEKSSWNKAYLEALPNVAVAEAFNEDYLLYLAEVSEYVRNNKGKGSVTSNKGLWIAICAAAVIVIIVIIAMNARK